MKFVAWLMTGQQMYAICKYLATLYESVGANYERCRRFAVNDSTSSYRNRGFTLSNFVTPFISEGAGLLTNNNVPVNILPRR